MPLGVLEMTDLDVIAHRPDLNESPIECSSNNPVNHPSPDIAVYNANANADPNHRTYVDSSGEDSLRGSPILIIQDRLSNLYRSPGIFCPSLGLPNRSFHLSLVEDVAEVGFNESSRKSPCFLTDDIKVRLDVKTSPNFLLRRVKNHSVKLLISPYSTNPNMLPST